MIEMENRWAMLENIEAIVERSMMNMQIDFLKCHVNRSMKMFEEGDEENDLMVCTSVTKENIEEIEENMLVMWENRWVMHLFHHDYVENTMEMLGLKIKFFVISMIDHQ